MLRPNSDYHVAVTTMDASQPTLVTVQVTGRKDSGGNPAISQELNVEPYFTRMARLQVPWHDPSLKVHHIHFNTLQIWECFRFKMCVINNVITV